MGQSVFAAREQDSPSPAAAASVRSSVNMAADGFALFDTAIGRCGIAWGGRGIAGVQLPEGREPQTRMRLLERFPDAREAPPPPEVEQAGTGNAALLRAEPGDLAGHV